MEIERMFSSANAGKTAERDGPAPVVGPLSQLRTSFAGRLNCLEIPTDFGPSFGAQVNSTAQQQRQRG